MVLGLGLYRKPLAHPYYLQTIRVQGMTIENFLLLKFYDKLGTCLNQYICQVDPL